jgi:hypothetical protein
MDQEDQGDIDDRDKRRHQPGVEAAEQEPAANGCQRDDRARRNRSCTRASTIRIAKTTGATQAATAIEPTPIGTFDFQLSTFNFRLSTFDLRLATYQAVPL